jgi:hypothetical protein
LRLREKREKELEKKRDVDFNSYRPMVPQGKESLQGFDSDATP